MKVSGLFLLLSILFGLGLHFEESFRAVDETPVVDDFIVSIESPNFNQLPYEEFGKALPVGNITHRLTDRSELNTFGSFPYTRGFVFYSSDKFYLDELYLKTSKSIVLGLPVFLISYPHAYFT